MAFLYKSFIKAMILQIQLRAIKLSLVIKLCKVLIDDLVASFLSHLLTLLLAKLLSCKKRNKNEKTTSSI